MAEDTEITDELDDLAEVDEEESDLPSAFTSAEWELVNRLNTICVWLAREKRRAAVLDLCRVEFGWTETRAQMWIAKAEEFMASGIFESVDAARTLYASRLNQIYSIAMAHAVRDRTKHTTKPTRVIDEKGQKKLINATHVEVKPNALDNQALQTALKAARELAHITGARPANGKRIHVDNMNVQVNNQNVPIGKTAQAVETMSNEQLAGVLGVEIVDAVASAPGSEVLSLPAQPEAPEVAPADPAGPERNEGDDPGPDEYE